MRLRRTCYDKPGRCPGWAGGGWKYPKPGKGVCPSGSLPTVYEAPGWRWRFHRCPTCGTVALPPVTRWVDPTWLWWVARRTGRRAAERARELPDLIADWCDRTVMDAHRPAPVPGDEETWPSGEQPWCLRCDRSWPCGPWTEADERLTQREAS